MNNRNTQFNIPQQRQNNSFRIYQGGSPINFSNEPVNMTTFTDQINFLNKLMENLATSKESVKNKKVLFQNALSKLIFHFNVEHDANRVHFFRLMVSFFKYTKIFLDPKWLTPLLDKIESKDSIRNFDMDSKEEILNLSQRLRSDMGHPLKKVNVAGNSKYWIEKAKKNKRSLEDSERWIIEYFERTMISKEKVSLMDPFSLTRINFPVRGQDCTHLQIFDLRTYVDRWYFTKKTNVEKSLWICPVCAGQTHPRNLYVDSFMMNVLEKHPDAAEIFLNEKAKVVSDDSKESKNVIELLSDDEPSQTEKNKAKLAPKIKSAKESAKASSPQKGASSSDASAPRSKALKASSSSDPFARPKTQGGSTRTYLESYQKTEGKAARTAVPMPFVGRNGSKASKSNPFDRAKAFMQTASKASSSIPGNPFLNSASPPGGAIPRPPRDVELDGKRIQAAASSLPGSKESLTASKASLSASSRADSAEPPKWLRSHRKEGAGQKDDSNGFENRGNGRDLRSAFKTPPARTASKNPQKRDGSQAARPTLYTHADGKRWFGKRQADGASKGVEADSGGPPRLFEEAQSLQADGDTAASRAAKRDRYHGACDDKAVAREFRDCRRDFRGNIKGGVRGVVRGGDTTENGSRAEKEEGSRADDAGGTRFFSYYENIDFETDRKKGDGAPKPNENLKSRAEKPSTLGFAQQAKKALGRSEMNDGEEQSGDCLKAALRRKEESERGGEEDRLHVGEKPAGKEDDVIFILDDAPSKPVQAEAAPGVGSVQGTFDDLDFAHRGTVNKNTQTQKKTLKRKKPGSNCVTLE